MNGDIPSRHKGVAGAVFAWAVITLFSLPITWYVTAKGNVVAGGLIAIGGTLLGAVMVMSALA